MIKKLTYYIVLLLYLYTVSFSFFPGKLKTRMVIGVIGAVYFCFKNRLQRNNTITRVCLLCMPVIIWSLLSMLMNGVFDSYFPRQMLLAIIYAFGCYFIIDFYKIDSLETLFKGIIVCIVVNNLIAMGGLFSGDFRSMVVDLQKFEKSSDSLISMTRAVGIGNVFFSGGIMSGLGMILNCYLYRCRHIGSLVFYLSFLFLFISGLLIARTTMVGLVGLFILVLPLRRNFGSIIKIATLGLILIFGIRYSSDYVSNTLGSEYSDWAFELFNNLDSSGKVETRSTDRMLEMYNTKPDNLKTWLIGDGLVNAENGGYYMHTDIGWLRLIWAMGIIGLILYIFYHWNILRYIRKEAKNVQMRILVSVLMGYMIILLFKGMVDLSSFFLLILFTQALSKKEITYNKYDSATNGGGHDGYLT